MGLSKNSEWLATQLVRLGMSRGEFAKFLQISPRTVQNWCNGRNRPPEAAIEGVGRVSAFISSAATKLVRKWTEAGGPDRWLIALADPSTPPHLKGPRQLAALLAAEQIGERSWVTLTRA